MSYFYRHIDQKLLEWKNSANRKPLLVRGARQVGKSSAVRHLGETFENFVEINLESQPSLQELFTDDIDVKQTCVKIGAVLGVSIVPGKTLLFIDEIQVSKNAIRSLRYFYENYPELHVIAAGSLLEFALEELPSFGVGRIRSIYLYPFSFDEFLMAQGLKAKVEYKNTKTSVETPLFEPLHSQLIEQLKFFYLVGGMPASVQQWVSSRDLESCIAIQRDILETYQDDFRKYKSRISPNLLRQVLHAVALQAGEKFVYAAITDAQSSSVKEALRLLTLAGLIIPVVHTSANGLPLGAEVNMRYQKYLFIDVGMMQTLLGGNNGDVFLMTNVDFVNKGGFSEMFAGLEMVKYSDCYKRAEMYYWQRMEKNALAEIDYLTVIKGKIIPVEVKANKSGSMQSMFVFMDNKKTEYGIRTSLENFSEYSNVSKKVKVIPLYALSKIFSL